MRPFGPLSCRHIFILAALSLLAGCANGDFGEVHPTLVSDHIHDWVGFDAGHGKAVAPSTFDLSDDERTLRDLAFPLIEPPYDRQRWYSVANEYGFLHRSSRELSNPSAYFSHLMTADDRSPPARYAQLVDDVRNDMTRLPQFFETAGRVLDLDDKRRKSLDSVMAVRKGEHKNALRRIQENAHIIAMVRSSLLHRVSSYRFALERLVVTTPLPQAADAEYAVNELQRSVANYATNLAPTWQRESSLAAND